MNEANLTVKCTKDDGSFSIWPAQNIRFYPASVCALDPEQGKPPRNKVIFDLPSGSDGSFDRGTVYVMNSAGKTIDMIYLDEPKAA